MAFDPQQFSQLMERLNFLRNQGPAGPNDILQNAYMSSPTPIPDFYSQQTDEEAKARQKALDEEAARKFDETLKMELGKGKMQALGNLPREPGTPQVYTTEQKAQLDKTGQVAVDEKGQPLQDIKQGVMYNPPPISAADLITQAYNETNQQLGKKPSEKEASAALGKPRAMAAIDAITSRGHSAGASYEDMRADVLNSLETLKLDKNQYNSALKYFQDVAQVAGILPQQMNPNSYTPYPAGQVYKDSLKSALKPESATNVDTKVKNGQGSVMTSPVAPATDVGVIPADVINIVKEAKSAANAKKPKDQVEQVLRKKVQALHPEIKDIGDTAASLFNQK